MRQGARFPAAIELLIAVAFLDGRGLDTQVSVVAAHRLQSAGL